MAPTDGPAAPTHRLADVLAGAAAAVALTTAEPELEEPTARLARLLGRLGPGAAGAAGNELAELPLLYRRASTRLAELAAAGGDPRELAELRELVLGAHQALFRGAREREAGLLLRALRFLLDSAPRAVRAEWKLLGALALAFYGLAAAAFLGVRSDLELAWTLFAPEQVEREIEQLRALAPGEPFRGNFTFGRSQSGSTSGAVLANNIGVALLFFGAGLVPPVFLLILVRNALMLGTYFGVAAHWGQADELLSLLACHGTIELQMIVLAGAGGLVLARAWLRPGPWSRGHALSLESRRAAALAAPAVPFLVFSGLIEGYVSPHAPLALRLVTALASGLLLLAWVAGAGWNPARARAGATQARAAR